ARPRSWPGVKPARCRARDRAVVSPVRSAVSRNAAAPACEITVSPSAVMVSALDHPVGSVTRKVPLEMGSIWLSTPRFSQIRGTFRCPDTTLHNKIVKRLGISGFNLLAPFRGIGGGFKPQPIGGRLSALSDG